MANIASHMGAEDLERCYREAKDPVERSHYFIIWHLSLGKSVKTVAEIASYSQQWIHKIILRYNTDGPRGLGDQRRDNRGNTSLLTPVQERDLQIALVFSPPPGGGVWNGRKVADWIANLIGRPVGRQRGWDYLKKFGFRLRKPRPQHVKGDQKQQQAFKKNS